MVSQELQKKFFESMETLRTESNHHILETIIAGAKAAFESDGSNPATPTEPAVGSPAVDSSPLSKLCEAIGKLRTDSNGALIEAIEEGAKACFDCPPNPQETGAAPAEPKPEEPNAPKLEYEFAGERTGIPSEHVGGVYAHGELESRLNHYDLVGITNMPYDEFYKSIVSNYEANKDFGHGIPVKVKGVDEPCILYIWTFTFPNGYAMLRGYLVLASDKDAIKDAEERWKNRDTDWFI